MSTVQIPYPLRSKLAGRRERLLWPSTAELAFMRLMGCWIIPLPFLHHPASGRPAVHVVMRGVLRREYVEREVAVRGYFVDFGNDLCRAIEIDGEGYHRDIIKEQERDQHLKQAGWELLHIKGSDLKRRPSWVRRVVTEFLEK